VLQTRLAVARGLGYIAATSNQQTSGKSGVPGTSGASRPCSSRRIDRSLLSDETRLAALIAPIAIAQGFALVRVAMIGGERAPTLQIMAEDPATGQMTLDQCATLSRALSVMLDEVDPIESEYRLEVSSPGIDRPLTRLADFDRWAGHAARIDLAEAVVLGGGARKRFTGVLVGAADDTITIDAEGLGPTTLAFASIRTAKLLLTDRLIAATVPISMAGADETETETDTDTDSITEDETENG
jgi:ribosome maturation factor RimP